MRKTLTMLVLFASLLAAGCGGGGETASPPADTPDTPQTTGASMEGGPGATGAENTISEHATLPVVIRASGGGAVEVVAEVADTRAERGQGLSKRTELAEDAGMLFVYNREKWPLAFQMRETLIPLSIAFIDSEGFIVDIQDMQPLDQEAYYCFTPAQYALEVNQGLFAERGVEVGDTVEIPQEYR
jgi:uncharacterized membrane protein (UPF0127 family)